MWIFRSNLSGTCYMIHFVLDPQQFKCGVYLTPKAGRWLSQAARSPCVCISSCRWHSPRDRLSWRKPLLPLPVFYRGWQYSVLSNSHKRLLCLALRCACFPPSLGLRLCLEVCV